jgi:uncharacterized protein
MLRSFCPHQTAKRVEDIDLEALRTQGVQGLLLDLDNTLTPWRGYEMTSACRAWFARARAQFRVCLLSNALSGRRVRSIAAELGVPCVHGLGPWGKPGRLAFRRALARTGTAPSRTAMIGDQRLVDVLGARRAGLRAILVEPLGKREFLLTRLNRHLARLIEAALRRQGLWPDACPRLPPPPLSEGSSTKEQVTDATQR